MMILIEIAEWERQYFYRQQADMNKSKKREIMSIGVKYLIHKKVVSIIGDNFIEARKFMKKEESR